VTDRLIESNNLNFYKRSPHQTLSQAKDKKENERSDLLRFYNITKKEWYKKCFKNIFDGCLD